MNIDQLKYIVESARLGSISTTAQHLNVSQSTISKSIQRLEYDLGVTIFTRSQSGVFPTSVGKVLLSQAHEILSKIEEFKEIIEEYKNSEAKNIRVRCIPVFSEIMSQAIE